MGRSWVPPIETGAQQRCVLGLDKFEWKSFYKLGPTLEEKVSIEEMELPSKGSLRIDSQSKVRWHKKIGRNPVLEIKWCASSIGTLITFNLIPDNSSGNHIFQMSLIISHERAWSCITRTEKKWDTPKMRDRKRSNRVLF